MIFVWVLYKFITKSLQFYKHLVYGRINGMEKVKRKEEKW